MKKEKGKAGEGKEGERVRAPEVNNKVMSTLWCVHKLFVCVGAIGFEEEGVIYPISFPLRSYQFPNPCHPGEKLTPSLTFIETRE